MELSLYIGDILHPYTSFGVVVIPMKSVELLLPYAGVNWESASLILKSGTLVLNVLEKYV